MKRSIQESAKRAAIKVGGGRGFVTEVIYRIDRRVLSRKLQWISARFITERIVMTAAHCLPHLPPAYPNDSVQERTYSALLGPLTDAKPSIMTECLFVDPVADIAILGEPDDQIYGDANLQFNEFINSTQVLRIGDFPARAIRTKGLILSLKGHWEKCVVERSRSFNLFSMRDLWIGEARLIGGMSGSPILRG